MAERPADKQNWQQREYINFGPGCRLDIDNPQMGLNGTTVYDLLAQGDDGNTSSLGMTSGGLFHLTNDQCIDIIGGEKAGAGCCVNIIGRNGDVTITAQANGQVKITGKNITIDVKSTILNIQPVGLNEERYTHTKLSIIKVLFSLILS